MLVWLISTLFSNLTALILHIQNTSSFPRPLSSKDEKMYIQRLANGDKNARAVLIERNLRLVSHIVKKYYAKTDCQDDLISIGTIGLIKAVDSFDASKGIRLATYASRCIENEILMYFRSIKKQSSDIFMSDTIEYDRDGNPLTVEDTLKSDVDLAEDLETKTRWSKVKKYIESMDDDRAREIIVLRYGLNNKKPLTQREVAQRLNISRSYVSRIEKRTLNEIKKSIK